MFIEEVELIKESFDRFCGTGMYFLLFFISIIFLCSKKYNNDLRIKIVFGFFSIIILFLNFNPIFTKIMVKVNGSSVYWRVFWLLPMSIGIIYMFTEMIFYREKKMERIGIITLFILIIIISGKFIYTSENFAKVDNYYKIPDYILEIIQHISVDDEEYKKVAGPLEFEIYTRQVDGNILLAEPRSFSGLYDEDSIVTYINEGNFFKIYEKALEIKCNYIIINNNLKNEDIDNYSFIEICTNEKYTLYKLNMEESK